jgi:hypothetical protein
MKAHGRPPTPILPISFRRVLTGPGLSHPCPTASSADAPPGLYQPDLEYRCGGVVRESDVHGVYRGELVAIDWDADPGPETRESRAGEPAWTCRAVLVDFALSLPCSTTSILYIPFSSEGKLNLRETPHPNPWFWVWLEYRSTPLLDARNSATDPSLPSSLLLYDTQLTQHRSHFHSAALPCHKLPYSICASLRNHQSYDPYFSG